MAAGEYLVLVRNPVTGEWREAGRGDPAEVRAKHGDEGAFVDVPTRSWNPYTRTKEVKTVTRTKAFDPSAALAASLAEDEDDDGA